MQLESESKWTKINEVIELNMSFSLIIGKKRIYIFKEKFSNKIIYKCYFYLKKIYICV